MTLKVIGTIGWICLALDAVLIVGLIAANNAGDDAAGRGVARGYGLVMLPILVAIGGLLWWATRAQSKSGVIVATVVAGIPFIMLANNKVRQYRENVAYRSSAARSGQFADADLRALAEAIGAPDVSKLRVVLASQKAANRRLDYSQRDKAGQTLLGFTVLLASDNPSTPDRLEALQLLLQAGVPYAADAVREGGDWVSELVGGGGTSRNAVIELGLLAGANANAKAVYESHNMILDHHVNLELAKILVAHGADVHALTGAGHTTLMNAIRFKLFPEALFYLQQGVDPYHVAPDGKTARSELERVVQEARNYQSPMEAGFDEFATAFNAVRVKSP